MCVVVSESVCVCVCVCVCACAYEDVNDTFDSMYVDSDKVKQDTFIHSHIILNPVQRRRRGNEQHRERQYEAVYLVSVVIVIVSIRKCHLNI